MTLIDFRQAVRRIAPTRAGFAGLVRDFLADCRIHEQSERTIDDHDQQLARYGAWLKETGRTWQSVQHADLTAFLRTRAHLGRSSRAHAITSLRRFYAWCVSEGHLSESPARDLKTPPRPKSVPKALIVEDAETLLRYLDTLASGTLTDQRDRALVLLGLYAGLRAAELASLEWSQLDLDAAIVTIPESKMARGRVVRLHPDVIPVLRSWREVQGREGRGSVFAIDRPTIVANRAGKIVKTVGLAAGVKGLTAHVLRHTFATWSLRKSGNLFAVSRALGHSQLQTTMVYIRSDPRDGEAAVLALPGLGDWAR
jgi:site-specific recombinase XerC